MKNLDFFSLQSTCILWCEQFGSWNWQSQSIGTSKKNSKERGWWVKKEEEKGRGEEKFFSRPLPLACASSLSLSIAFMMEASGLHFCYKKRLRLFCTDFLFVSVWYVKFLVHAFLSEKPYMTLLHPKNWQRGYDCQDFDFDCKGPWT